MKQLVFYHFIDILVLTSELNKGEHTMKIVLEGSLLKMTPENDGEKEELNQLWTLVIDCANNNRKLVPVGEYLPGTKEVATFNIE